MTLQDPGVVVIVHELVEGQVELIDGVEGSKPKELFFPGPHEGRQCTEVGWVFESRSTAQRRFHFVQKPRSGLDRWALPWGPVVGPNIRIPFSFGPDGLLPSWGFLFPVKIEVFLLMWLEGITITAKP